MDKNNTTEISQSDDKIDNTRRSLLKAGYVAPAIVTLSAIPSFASAGSYRNKYSGYSNLTKKQKISAFKKWVQYWRNRKYGD